MGLTPEQEAGGVVNLIDGDRFGDDEIRKILGLENVDV